MLRVTLAGVSMGTGDGVLTRALLGVAGAALVCFACFTPSLGVAKADNLAAPRGSVGFSRGDIDRPETGFCNA